ncbi:MAG TPA: hypothetical protein VFB62_16090 [Polyangiaceae bacterium]|jgi:hypothetical protein|nr:hypothetical protein [Polyangiaceae bacterium]
MSRHSYFATSALTFAAAALIGCGSSPGDPTQGPSAELSTPERIEGYLESKILLMEGSSIPTHPNGYSRDVNFGQATQCYNRVEMLLTASNFNVDTTLGTLMNAPEPGDVGTCDQASEATKLEFVSTSYVVENIQGDAECFDFTITYPGFGQEGRGRISEDRSELELEIFFLDQATGHRCADGAVGAGGIVLKGEPFSGDAVQVYKIVE